MTDQIRKTNSRYRHTHRLCNIWHIHDNTDMPATVRHWDWIEAYMSDGYVCHADAGDLDWHHESDPILAFKILAEAPA